jgi:YegS/Rv2252/BmrU family lipid kinase
LKKNILFVINPISGGQNKKGFTKLADHYLDKNMFEAKYIFTEAVGHAYTISRDAIANDTDIVIAVGGDGTMNEVASALEGTARQLGIIPCGSGNGLARSLGIPLDHRKAILRLNRLEEQRIDSAVFNGKKFFNMAGMGFDAHISARFARDTTRGLRGYVKTTLQEIASYKAQVYKIEIDGNAYEDEAFMLSIANSSQFGNNAHISPSASMCDGLLDVCIVKTFPLYLFPVLGYHMFNKSVDKSQYVDIIKGKYIRIQREKEGPVHLDGEPSEMGKEINIEVKQLSLRVLK